MGHLDYNVFTNKEKRSEQQIKFDNNKLITELIARLDFLELENASLSSSIINLDEQLSLMVVENYDMKQLINTLDIRTQYNEAKLSNM